MVLLAAALGATTAASVAERWVAAETAYLALFALLLRFAVGRLRAAEGARRPPAAFVLIPIAIVHGVAGGVLVLVATLPGVPGSLMALGRLLVEQGVFLCLVVGVGALVLPLMAGAAPPADLGSTPAERRKAILYAGAGVAIGSSLVLEYAGWERVGPLLRAAVVTAGLGLGGARGGRRASPACIDGSCGSRCGSCRPGSWSPASGRATASPRCTSSSSAASA
jgi:hypothetical protein